MNKLRKPQKHFEKKHKIVKKSWWPWIQKWKKMYRKCEYIEQLNVGVITQKRNSAVAFFLRIQQQITWGAARWHPWQEIRGPRQPQEIWGIVYKEECCHVRIIARTTEILGNLTKVRRAYEWSILCKIHPFPKVVNPLKFLPQGLNVQ